MYLTRAKSLNVGIIKLVKTLGIINQVFQPTLSNSSDHGQTIRYDGDSY